MKIANKWRENNRVKINQWRQQAWRGGMKIIENGSVIIEKRNNGVMKNNQ